MKGKSLLSVTFFVTSLLLIVMSCSDKSGKEFDKKDNLPEKFDTVQHKIVIDSIFNYKINRVIKYHTYPVKGMRTLKELDTLYGKEGRSLILSLNRLDSWNMRKGDSLVIPDTIAHMLTYSPYPYKLENGDSISKLIIISRKIQAFAAYENGYLRRWGPTSTGRKSKQTPAGLFHFNWKSKKTISTIDSTWILPFYFNFHNKEGIALHQFAMPGYPASHACVRLRIEDAEWIYNWANQWVVSNDGERVLAYGTPLIIFDDYKFGSPPPWKYLMVNPDTARHDQTQLEEVIIKYSKTILERQVKRDSILAARMKPVITSKTN